MKRLCIYVFCLTGFLLLSCCHFFSNSCLITGQLPDIPRHWVERFTSFTYEIWYVDATGVFQRKSVENSRKSFSIKCRKQRNSPILVYPYAGTMRLPPAGALFPLDICDPEIGIIKLTWEKGFTALLIMECMNNGFDMTSFNTERLHNELIERAEGDIWNLDYTLIAQKLISGSFSVNSIKKLPFKEVAFYPGAGKWFLESPFSPLFTLDDRQMFISPLTYGYHRLFHLSSHLSYSLFIDHTDIIVIGRDEDV
jgi:hypothetical protein